jgi:hypothetical protein
MTDDHRIGPSASPAPDVGKSSDALRRATGRDYADWFGLLDAHGAAGRPYRDNAAWLTGEHGVSAWWAQKLLVEYEQLRGVREAGVRPDGTFSAGLTRTIHVPLARLEAAFVDPGLRARWLPDVALRRRTAQPGRSARYDVGDDGTRLNVSFQALDAGRSQVAVEHERLADPEAADRAKAAATPGMLRRPEA